MNITWIDLRKNNEYTRARPPPFSIINQQLRSLKAHKPPSPSHTQYCSTNAFRETNYFRFQHLCTLFVVPLFNPLAGLIYWPINHIDLFCGISETRNSCMALERSEYMPSHFMRASIIMFEHIVRIGLV